MKSTTRRINLAIIILHIHIKVCLLSINWSRKAPTSPSHSRQIRTNPCTNMVVPEHIIMPIPIRNQIPIAWNDRVFGIMNGLSDYLRVWGMTVCEYHDRVIFCGHRNGTDVIFLRPSIMLVSIAISTLFLWINCHYWNLSQVAAARLRWLTSHTGSRKTLFQ